MKNFNTEMIEKAKAAKSAEELITLAKENGVDMTADEAATYFAQLNPKSGELDDDDLETIAGGGCNSDQIKSGDRVRVITGDRCSKCGTTVGKYKKLHIDGFPIYCVKCTDCTVYFCRQNQELIEGVHIERI